MILNNEKFRLEIIEKGGEIQSLFDKEANVEYMWQGDENIWTGKNPTLFPLCCGLYKKSYELNGNTYPMENHGFIRVSDMKCIYSDDKKVTMELKQNEYTLSRYPFDFTFHTNYELNDNKVIITYDITNDSEVDMPFTFGQHPGFNVPVYNDEKFEDYKLVFPIEEDAEMMIIDKTKTHYPDIVATKLKEFNLNYEDFRKYSTLLYRNIKSPYVDLVGKNQTIRVSIEGYKYLAIWTVADAPFLCIEPWHATGDFYDVKEDIYNRKDTIVLKPEEVWTTQYSIEIIK